MSSIPYNYGKYVDDSAKLKDQGTIGAGEQINSPSSAGSRGLAQTTQFTKDSTQMKMGQKEGMTPMAESMVEIRSILNRIDGVNAPVQEEEYTPFPEADEFDIEEDEDFEEVLGPLGFPEDETELFDAEYQGRKVPLNKPMRGDVKKFKVYVRDPKTKNIKKVNFGDPNMRIKKSNPARRRSFRARHNCANPGPRTKARYWSCRKW